MPKSENSGIIDLMLFGSIKMTTDKGKNGFMWSKVEPMRGMQMAEYRQVSYDAEFRYADYEKETPRGEIDDIKPEFRSGSDNIPYLEEFRWQTMSEKSEFRMGGFRHSKLNT